MNRFLCLSLFALAAAVQAQDAAAIANMQAIQQAQQIQQQQAVQQQIQQQQQINQQVQLQQQLNQQTINDMAYYANRPWTARPSFSVSEGKVAPGTMVRITTKTHYAKIYYTTDGWTPTSQSNEYTGPIEIKNNTLLRAIAIAPHMNRSLVAHAEYTTGTAAQPDETSVNTTGTLRAGTALRLVTDAKADSKSNYIGDKLTLKLDEDIKSGDNITIPKGTPVAARITLADPASHGGMPGDLSFQITSIDFKQFSIPVTGGETEEGSIHVKRLITLLLIPGGAIPAALSKGDEAIIVPGMKLNVTVAHDITLLDDTVSESSAGSTGTTAN